MSIQPPEEWPALRLDYDNARDTFVLVVQDSLGGPAMTAYLDAETRDALARQARDLLETPKAQTDMQVHVTRHRYANMGDHAEYVTEAQAYDPTEAVEAMVLRVLRLQEAYQRIDPGDSIIIRVVEGTEPTREAHSTGL